MDQQQIADAFGRDVAEAVQDARETREEDAR